jgi:hypothetical protein
MAYVFEASDLLTSAHERADDIPLLLAHLRRMGIPSLLDEHMPPGGPWGALSPGWVATLWLAHMLSQSESKPRHVQPWVTMHPETLRAGVGHEVLPADVHDLRLRDLLQSLGDDGLWHSFERALNHRLLDCYELDVERVGVRRSEGWSWQILPEGVLQVSQARVWRPGTLRLQVLQASIEPLGLPLATAAFSTRAAPEGVVGTLVGQAQAALRQPQVLFTGDELQALEVRAMIRASGGVYLCRLPDAESAAGVLAVGHGAQPLMSGEDGQGQPQGEGYEWVERLAGDGEGWEERRLLVRSRTQARAAEYDLRERLARACEAVAGLCERKRGKRRLRTLEALEHAVQEVLESYGVLGLVTLRYDESVAERLVRRYRGRPTSLRVERDVQVAVAVDEAALQGALGRSAWELHATNLPPHVLAPAQLLHDGGRHAPGFERLSGRPLSLSSSGMQRDEQVVGLVRLLSLALRALVLLEAAVYRQLVAEERDEAQGGERRRVAQQAGERLLDAFREIVVTPGRGPRNPTLTPLQRRVLHLLRLPPDIYG